MPLAVTNLKQVGDNPVRMNQNGAVAVTSTSPSIVHPMITRSKLGIFRPKAFGSWATVFNPVPIEPKTYREVMKNELWRDAMNKEMAAL